MARHSRRQEVVDSARSHFLQSGYEGTSVGDVADDVGVSKAAVSYHFPAKVDLLAEVAEPLLTELEALLPEDATPPQWPDGVRALLAAYLEVLLRHHELSTWLGGDRAVVINSAVGERLRASNARMRAALVGDTPSPRTRVAASIALGALWRPVRNVDAKDVAAHRDLMIESALAPLRMVR